MAFSASKAESEEWRLFRSSFNPMKGGIKSKAVLNVMEKTNSNHFIVE